MSLTQQVASGVRWNSATTLVRVLVQFLSLAVLAHLLAPADFGLLSMATVITGFIQSFIDFGIGNAIIYRQETQPRHLASLYWLNVFVGLILFLLVWAGAPLASICYQEPRLTSILRWSSTIFILLPFGQQFHSLLQRDMRFALLSLIHMTESVVYAVSAIVLALCGYGVMSLVIATLIRVATQTLLLIVQAIRFGWQPSFHFHPSDVAGFLRFGLFQMGERAINYLASNVDYLIVGRLLGVQALGFYTLAYNLIRMPLTYINPIVVAVAFPAFARVQHQNDTIRRGYGKMLHYLGATTFPIMAGLLVSAPLLVPWVYGKGWDPSVAVVQIFCLLGAVKSLSNPLGSVLLAKGRADLGLLMNVLALFGYGLLNWVGAYWGIRGVAASSVLFLLFVLLPVDFYLRHRMIGMRALEFWKAIRQPALATGIMLALLVTLKGPINGWNNPTVGIMVLIGSGIILYGGSMWYLDRPLLKDFFHTFIAATFDGKR